MHIAGAERGDILGFWTFQGHFHWSLYACWGSSAPHWFCSTCHSNTLHLQYRMEESFSLFPPLPTSQILRITGILQILRCYFLGLACILHFKMKTQYVANETPLRTTQSLTVHSVFTWMHPTCLIQCATSSSCTAVFSRIHIQQLDFLV